MGKTVTANILAYDGQRLLLKPDESISRELAQKSITRAEIRLDDGRRISADQRKKIFALIGDIAEWNGDAPEALRPILTWQFRALYDVPDFSLSDVDMSTAKDFINYLIDFCFDHAVPTRDTLLNRTDDIGKYLYSCLEHRKCAVCNDSAEVHHVDKIGMGRDRERVVHIGLRAIALCRKHHEEAHRNEKVLFAKYHIYGIRLDKYLCDVLRLNADERR